MTFEDVRQLALAWPGVEDGSSYGTPALKVRGKLLCRLKEDGETLVVRISFDERELLMGAEPETFFVTDHYKGYPYVLIRLSRADKATVERFIERYWRDRAPKKVLAAHDAGKA